MKLISMREFVLENIEKNTGKMKMGGVAKSLHQINEYAKFLSQPLTLGMFVPCDEEGNILDCDPILYGGKSGWEDKYHQAKERVLFEGFEFINETESHIKLKIMDEYKKDNNYNHTSFLKTQTVECLTGGIYLTPSAIKQLEL